MGAVFKLQTVAAIRMADFNTLDTIIAVALRSILLLKYILGKAPVVLSLIRIAGKATVQIYDSMNNLSVA